MVQDVEVIEDLESLMLLYHVDVHPLAEGGWVCTYELNGPQRVTRDLLWDALREAMRQVRADAAGK